MEKTYFVDPEALIDESIFELLGLTEAPSDKKDQIMDDMIVTVQNRVLARILDILGSKNEALIDEFKILLDANNPAESKDFLNSNEIDLDKLTAEEALNYKMQIVNLVNPV